MRSVIAWQETPPEKDGIRNVCYDLCFKPDGSQIVTGIGSRVLVYDAVEGELVHSLKGHKDSVYCVAYAQNGKRFASGGADKTVIIWTSKGEGILKYSHNDSIQSLAYNPITQQLASATATDLGLWSPEQKSVAKHKVSSKIVSLSWNDDGSCLALGLHDGTISIRDKAGQEQLKVEAGSSPVWTVTWNHAVLCVGCWDGALKFFTTTGQQAEKTQNLEFDPLCTSVMDNGDYLLISGTDKCVHLYSKQGIYLLQVAQRDSWIWVAKARPKHNFIAVGDESGTLTVYSVVFSTVHGLYQDRYAYRDVMTDVIIQHLITEQKVRIKCRDHVKKIAVYKDKLAVQLPQRIVIYKLSNATDYDMHYQSATKITGKLDCNLLVVTCQHIILCQERKLQLYGFDGVKEREWVLDSVIRYIKVVGGAPRKEGLLVGLKNGIVLKIFIDNPFPIQLYKHTASVRCLDLSSSQGKLAVVDDNAIVVVYNTITKELVFEAKNANSVAWNTQYEDMLCYSGKGILSIKTGNFPVHEQKLQGFVVGFKGSKIFCLHYVSMQTIDVPQSMSMYRYLEKKDYKSAYKVACLGVTNADWQGLALDALSNMHLDVARQAFIRIRDVRFVELVNKTEQLKKKGANENLIMADIMAYQSKFQEAATLFTQAGMVERAMEMFSDLRMFDEAKKFAEDYARIKGDQQSVHELINKQAEWSEEVNNYEAAAEMYIKAKKYERAVAILSRMRWWDKLIGMVRALEKKEVKILNTCASHFRKASQFVYAKETYVKLDDTHSLIMLYAEEKRWDDAFLLLHAHPEVKSDVYLPYAKWLVEEDRFDEARVAYAEAGRPELSIKLMEQLCHNAVMENRFQDAAYYLYDLATEAIKGIKNPPHMMDLEDRKALEKFSELYNKAEIYYAYHHVYLHIHQPFRTIHASTLFNMARFVLMRTLHKPPPFKVSLTVAVYILAKQAVDRGAFKLARFAYQKLHNMLLPVAWQAEVDLQSIIIRSKPFTDQEDLQPVCYRCSITNPLLNVQGDFCVSCGMPFIRSFVTFDHLPLVEFELEPDISDDEALRIIGEDASSNSWTSATQGLREHTEAGANVLRLDDTDDYMAKMADPFSAQMLVPNTPIRVDRPTLKKLRTSEVLVRKWPNAKLPNQYFRIMDPDLPIVCGPCGHFFEQDEYEMAALEKNAAPFSREAIEPECMDAEEADGSTLPTSMRLNVSMPPMSGSFRRP